MLLCNSKVPALWNSEVLCFLIYIFLFTGPPPIPADPIASPEPAYVSKVHYGRKVFYGVLFWKSNPIKN